MEELKDGGQPTVEIEFNRGSKVRVPITLENHEAQIYGDGI